jgi:hypothetical protein
VKGKGKELEEKSQGSGLAMASVHDIKEDIVKGLGNSLPVLERCFQMLRVLV